MVSIGEHDPGDAEAGLYTTPQQPRRPRGALRSRSPIAASSVPSRERSRTGHSTGSPQAQGFCLLLFDHALTIHIWKTRP